MTAIRVATMLRVMSAAVAAMVCVSPLPAGAQQLTPAAVLAAPFTYEISGSPASGAVAWIQDVGGVRNVWVARPPAYEGRQVTAFSADDGIDLTSLVWTPDGQDVVFVRGGAANAAGEFPNPAQVPEGAEQSVWIARADGSPATRIGSGGAPAVSRTGQVASVVRGQVWSTSIDGRQAPKQLFATRGQMRELRWSPDGARLLFISRRDDHSFVGIYDTVSGVVRFLDPSVDVDSNPVWSPDGRQVAFVRVPSSRTTYVFQNHLSDRPWSIRVADVSTGLGRQVWQANEGRGSVFVRAGAAYDTPDAASELLWGADDRLVFPWEGDGWSHLYSISVSGGAPLLLTPGEFEVYQASLTPDRRRVIYGSNAGDVNRRHVWSVPVAGGPPTQLTSGRSIEARPTVAGNETIAFVQSDHRTPADPVVQTRSQVKRLSELPASPTSHALVEPEAVIFTATDGLSIHAQLFLPPNRNPGVRSPALVYFHGGPFHQMLLGWHYASYYHHTYALNQVLASRGYVVLSVNFRGGTGYGLNFREALNHGASGASEVADVVGAGLYLRTRDDVDPERIGAWGGSYGGYLTAHALARWSNIFKAGVDIHGPHDWNVGIRAFVPGYNPSPEVQRRNLDASPISYVASWRSPVLLVHGDDDRSVFFSQTVALVEELRRAGVSHETLIIPDEAHGFLRRQSWVRVFDAAVSFLDRHLPASPTKP